MEKAIVYVVDDSDLVLDLVRTILERTDEFSCTCFSSGTDLLARLQPWKIDCVVADLKMPEVDGEELFQRVRECDPFVSLVIMTGFADVKTAVRLMEQGTFTVLEKPFSNEELVAAVKRATQNTHDLRNRREASKQAAELKARLTPEELEVLECVVEGLSNKVIANKLILSSRTLDRRKQSILKKLNVGTAAEAVALVIRTSGDSV